MGTARAEPPATASGKRDYFYSDVEEPHAARRMEILKKHPEIKSLMGFEWRTKYIVLATVSLQIFSGWMTLDWGWPAFLAYVYIVGATATHSLFLAIHELAHNLGARTPDQNKLIAMVANLPIGVPYCISFKPYHMEHHKYQGQDGIDSDVPTWFEGYVISQSTFGRVDHCVRKAVFMACQIFAYALRPLFIKPFLVPLDGWLAANVALTLGFDALMAFVFGPEVLLYIIFSSVLAGSIHPTAGHFIAEHYVMEGRAETYSYYGPLNMLAYNVGYHNEHHDFPNVAWSNLPKVRAMAPEFYDHLPQCESWPGIILRYIFDDSITPFSRVKRLQKQA